MAPSNSAVVVLSRGNEQATSRIYRRHFTHFWCFVPNNTLKIIRTRIT